MRDIILITAIFVIVNIIPLFRLWLGRGTYLSWHLAFVLPGWECVRQLLEWFPPGRSLPQRQYREGGMMHSSVDDHRAYNVAVGYDALLQQNSNRNWEHRGRGYALLYQHEWFRQHRQPNFSLYVNRPAFRIRHGDYTLFTNTTAHAHAQAITTRHWYLMALRKQSILDMSNVGQHNALGSNTTAICQHANGFNRFSLTVHRRQQYALGYKGLLATPPVQQYG
jgi:hypothetical protein